MHSIALTYRFFALCLATLMLLTSAGITVDMHFCRGELKTLSLFGEAKSCHKTGVMKNCPRHAEMTTEQGDSMSRKKCCENKTLSLLADQTQEVQNFSFVLSQQVQQFLIAYVAVFHTGNAMETGTPDFAHYKPPLIVRDIPVHIQSFLL